MFDGELTRAGREERRWNDRSGGQVHYIPLTFPDNTSLFPRCCWIESGGYKKSLPRLKTAQLLLGLKYIYDGCVSISK